MSFTLKGDRELRQRISQAAQKAPQVWAGALFRRGEAIMATSKEDFVPVKDGILKSTGHVELPKIAGGDISVTLGYGGPAAPYALVQHERLDFQHTVGEAKYLERPVTEAGRTLAADLARDVGVKDLV